MRTHEALVWPPSIPSSIRVTKTALCVSVLYTISHQQMTCYNRVILKGTPGCVLCLASASWQNL